MPKFKVYFWGRTLGAIGLNYDICVVVEGKDKEEARGEVYKKYYPYFWIDDKQIEQLAEEKE